MRRKPQKTTRTPAKAPRKRAPQARRKPARRRAKAVPRPPAPDLVALKQAAETGGNALFPEISNPHMRAYLAAYALTGKLMVAAELSGVTARTTLNWRNNDEDEAFQAAFASARALAGDILEAEIMRRAVEGIDEPVYQQGRLVGFVRRYSDRLLEMAAKGAFPEKYRERFEHMGKDGAPLFAAGFPVPDCGNGETTTKE